MILGLSHRLVPGRRAGVVVALVLAMVAAGVAIAPRFNKAEAAGINLAVSIANASKVEGNSGTSNMAFDVTMTGVVLSATTVNYTTSNGTATEPADYTKQSGSLTFTTAGTKQILVPIVGDTTPEPNETLIVTIGGEGFTVNDGTATGTITNDDFALTVADLTVNEGNSGTSNAAVTISLSAPRNTATQVKYATVDGTAKASADYTNTSGTATIPADETSVTVNVPVVGDTLYEDDETFQFKLSEPTNGVTLGDDTAVITIDDNETPPADGDKPVVSVASTSFKEGASGATSTANFTVSLSKASNHTETVKASTTDGTAKNPGDYQTKTNFLITFAPGETTQTFPVTINGDAVFEGDETFTVTLSEPSVGIKLASPATATGTILEDEARPTLSVANAQANEGSEITFTLTLSAAAGVDTTVRYASTVIAPTTDADYTKVPTGSTTVIPAGQTTKQIKVQTTQDTIDEPNETFLFGAQIIDGEFVSNPPAQATGTIVDDDPSPKISIADLSKDEGNEGDTTFTFTVTLSFASQAEIKVNYGTSGETALPPADFTPANGTLTFAPGETTKTFAVTVKGDTTSEDDETFKISLTNPVNAEILDGIAVGTIENDDAPLIHADHLTTGAGAGGGAHVKAFDVPGGSLSANFIVPFAGSPGARVARGDLDGDGKDELIVAPGPGILGRVAVYTSKGEGVIAFTDPYDNFFGGVFVATGDLDGDGKDELITTPGAGGGPHVRVFKLTGTAPNRQLEGVPGFFATDGGFQGGLFVAAGDVDADGKDEIVIGHGAGGQSVISVWRFNPATNAQTPYSNEFLAFPGFGGGVRVAAGDLDGDDKAEIVAAAGPGGNPHVRVMTAIGNPLPGSTYAYNEGFRGGVYVAVGDVDGDGTNEVITGAGPGGGPHVRTFDVLMAPLSTSFFAYDQAFSGGVFVAAGKP